jgi:hypothetical protein
MAVTVQKGTTLKIGFASNTYTGYFMQDFTTSPTGTQTEIHDEDGATTTVLVSNLGNQIDFTAIIKDTGSLTAPAIGSSVTINSVLYRTLSSSVKQTAGAAVLTFSGIKETSMTYT